MFNIPTELIMYALLGSIIPSIFWLWFWSRRDRFCPEPRIHLYGAFIFGALAALFTLPTQSLVASIFGATAVATVILFVCVEEYAKYVCSWYSVMRKNPYFNERIDPIIYLSTTALGFAFLENILYFIQYLNNFDFSMASVEGGKRIIGATILHMVSSGVIGVLMATAFFSNRIIKSIALVAGLIMAIAIHAAFNFLVVYVQTDYVLIAFSLTWFLLMMILVILELIRSKTCPTEVDWSEYNQ